MLFSDEKVTNLDEIPANQTSKGLTVKLSSGRTLTADLVIPCFGLTVNSEAYQRALGLYLKFTLRLAFC